MSTEQNAGPWTAIVLSCTEAAEDIMRLEVQVPHRALEHAVPGQFADFLVPDDPGWHVLRRPLSLAGIDPANNRALFYFRCDGPGTKILAKAQPGQGLNVLMPLGRGYTPPRPEEQVWLVGGGTGAAAVLAVPSFYQAGFTLFLGFQTNEQIFGFTEAADADLVLACDTSGVLVTDLVREALEEGRRPDRILACGPMPMYRALAKVAHGIPTEISLEERMGCGTGGCQACEARVGGRLVRTCSDGPVFPLEEVDGIAD